MGSIYHSEGVIALERRQAILLTQPLSAWPAV
jgi:hypothetical protein